MRRRGFMMVLGAAGATVALSACDRMPASAVQAWNGPLPAAERDIRLKVLSWAMLAPNPHNLQSWIADVRRPETIVLQVDRTRLLPQTDPQGRQILIGCGAFLELLRMGAAADGWQADTTLLPDGPYPDDRLDERPFATVRLRRDAGVQRDPLFEAVRTRRTNRANYEDRVPEGALLQQLQAATATPGVALTALTQPAQVRRIAALAVRGYEVEFRDPKAWGETAEVMRIGAPAVALEPSGVAVLGTDVWWGRQVGMLNAAAMARTDGIAATRAVTSSTEAAHHTPVWSWLVTADNSRISQLAAGRAYVRWSLSAAQLGLAVQPNSQVLQEFPAMQGAFADFHREAGVAAPGRVQMLARLGYGRQPGPAPRRAVERLLRI